MFKAIADFNQAIEIDELKYAEGFDENSRVNRRRPLKETNYKKSDRISHHISAIASSRIGIQIL
jgi:hypothetical protein